MARSLRGLPHRRAMTFVIGLPPRASRRHSILFIVALRGSRPELSPRHAMFSRFVARFPTTVASAIYALVVALAYLPLWFGRVLLSNDQLTGYAFRAFAAEHAREFGSV